MSIQTSRSTSDAEAVFKALPYPVVRERMALCSESMALICLRTNFCVGPEVYQDIGDWHRHESKANMREESEVAPPFSKCRAIVTHLSSSHK
jgi:hypothetical protein